MVYSLTNLTSKNVEFEEISLNKYVKVQDLGKSKKGQSKYLVAIKKSFKEKITETEIIYKMKFAEGIFFPNSTTFYAHTRYSFESIIPKVLTEEQMKYLTEPIE